MKKPVVGAVEMWKSGPPFAGFPSPVERVENSLWVFEFSTLSTGRHFHGAFPLVVLGAKRRGLRLLAALFAHRFTLHLDPVGVVHEPVQDAVGERRVADLGVPLG